MRIIGRLPDPRMQITVFENDGRFPVQFELGGVTQVYRFRKGEGLQHFGHVESLVDESFRTGVMEQFHAMHRIHAAVNARLGDSAADDPHGDLPDII